MEEKNRSALNSLFVTTRLLLGMVLFGLLLLLGYATLYRSDVVTAIAAAVLLCIEAAVYFVFTGKICRPILQFESIVNQIEAQSEPPPDEATKDRLASLDIFLQRLKETIDNECTAQLLKTKAEIHALQSQINPHFLYNTLETIRNQAMQRNVFEIAEMTEALATLFRYSVSRPGEMATFEEEIKNVENYLLIQQYRFRGKFKIINKIDRDDDALMGYRLPVLTIQPIIENAIHHGLETKIGTGTITIRAFTTQSRLVIFIADDGLGICPEKLDELNALFNESELYISPKEKGSGIALLNVHQRIRFFFGKEYGLFVTSTLDVGTAVEIHLPKISG